MATVPQSFDPPPATAGIPGGDRRAQMYPVLSEAQIEALRPAGVEKSFAKGDCLWDVGTRNVAFHVVLEGELEIVRRSALGDDSVLVVLRPGTYSGEAALLSGRAAMVAGRAGTDLTVLVLPVDGLRDIMVTHATLSELIMRSFILRRVRLISEHVSDLLLIGSRHSADTLRLQEFLTRNAHPYTFFDLESAGDVCATLVRFNVRPDETPIVITSKGEPLRNPSLRELASRLGLSLSLDQQAVHDVAVIGAGPAGLAAAVYAASEGLDAIVVDPVAPGGQAGTSSKIENYLGFPTGISGEALAGRAFMQAQKFGAQIEIPARLVRLHCGNPFHELELDNGERVRSRTVIIASGARYRKPALERLESLEGAGVYYGATWLESQFCREQEIAVIGGGNSAGQAAVFLSDTARKVYVLIRSEGLAASMSRYLIRRIETTENIELLTWTEVVALDGDEHLEVVRWRNRQSGEETTRPIRHLFVFIGATPNTDFLSESVQTDAHGFVCTGPDVFQPGVETKWPIVRPPLPLETSCPGVFAAGDVRANSTKRVASAVGEGSVVVQYVHRVLA
ncbi:MAG TPA: FAD-dependent oxidoreductase [Woeseiaceae bacterium]|nr:FAD-dependent oxidoreductase [Woeseiaceae bacterium]